MRIMYATREQVLASLERSELAHSNSLIDARIGAASHDAEAFLKRRFYPEQRTILVDWPNRSSSYTWEIDLGINEMISVSQVLSAGTNITADVILRRMDDIAEPPYSILEVDLASSSAYSSSTTFQQAISISGLMGYSDTETSLAGATLSGAINSSVTSIVLNPSSGTYTPGVGSLLLIGTERIVVMDRRMSAVSGQTIASLVAATQATRIVAVTSGAAFAVGETILIDAESMRIDDIAGNNLIVTRAINGSALAEHTSTTAIYAQRTFTVVRGALGSTAASHSDAASVYVHRYPDLLTELTIANTVVWLEQNASGYSRVVGSGANQRDSAGRSVSSSRESQYVAGLADLRARAWWALCRDKSRKAAV